VPRFSLPALLALAACATATAPPASELQVARSASNLAAAAPEAPPDGEEGAASLAERRLVYTAWLTLEVDDEDQVRARLARARAIASEAGGYVAQSRTDGATLRVPNDRFDQTLAALEALGKVTSRRQHVQDVTAEYVDLAARVKNTRKLQQRLRELLARAEKVEDILAVERELARVTEQLERLEGQMRLMKNQTAYATVDVEFRTAVRPGPIGWVFYGLYHGVKWLFVWD